MTQGSGSGLEALDSVTLDVLTAVAAYQTRVDRKYLLPADELPTVLNGLPVGTRVLDVAEQRLFCYRSVYLDTPDFDTYLAAGRRRRRRFKVRTRTYLDTDTSWLEVKLRTGRGTTSKVRITHPDALDRHVARTGLNTDGGWFVDRTLADARLPGRWSHRLQPTLEVTYRRATLLLPDRSARVTVDSNLRWSSLLRHADRWLPATVVLETKTSGRASAVDRWLWQQGHRPVRMSKYGTGLATLHTDLPDLKWHRVLQRHFPPT